MYFKQKYAKIIKIIIYNYTLMAISTSREVLSWDSSNLEAYKVSQLQEKFDIHVTQEELQEYWETLFNLKEIQALKEGRLTVSLLALEKLKIGMETPIKAATETFRQNIKPQEIAESTSNNLDKLGENLNEAYNEVWDSKTWQKIKTSVNQAKEAVTTWTIWKAFEKVWQKIAEAFTWLGNLFKWIFEFFKSLFMGMMGKKKLDEVKDGVKDVLKPEEVEKTKHEVHKYILSNFWESLDQEWKVKLDTSINNLSKDQILKFYDKFKKWKINISDIIEIAPNMFKNVFSEQQKQKIEIQAQEKIIFSLKSWITKEYPSVDLSWSKWEELAQLVKANYKFSDESLNSFLKIQEKQEILLQDLFSPTYDVIYNWGSLFIWLISKQIIPLSAIWLNLAESWADVLKLTAQSIWIERLFNTDALNKELDKLSPEEKALFIAILYRKWWMFFNILGSITWSITKLWVEVFTSTSVKSIDLIWSALTSNHTKQIQNFEKIAKWLWWYKDEAKILDIAKNNLNILKENYKVLEILSSDNITKSTNIADDVLKALHQANITPPPWITNQSTLDDIYKIFAEHKQITTTITSSWLVSHKLWFWANADLFAFNKQLEKVSLAQKAMFEWWAIKNLYWKTKEILSIWKLSRLWDRITLHFESLDAAKKWISKWKILANMSPEIIKWTLDKLPIIAIAGISLNTEGPLDAKLQEFWNQLKYLFPIVWPIWLAADSGFRRNKETWVIEWINTVEASIAWALITLDWIFVSKEFITGWVKWVGKYMIKPIKDIYSIWRWSAEGLYSLGKAISNGKSFTGILKQAAEKTKHFKKPKLRAVALLWAITYLWYDAAFADNGLEEVFGADWKMNKEQLKKEISSLWDEDKTLCLKYLIAEVYGSEILNNIQIIVKENKINIVSSNENVQWDWIINNEMKETLQLSPEHTFEYKPAETIQKAA